MKNKVICVVHGEESNTGRIGRVVREKGLEEVRYCVKMGDTLPTNFDDIAGAVVFGGPMSANDDDTLDFIATELRWMDDVLASGTPFLGVCLGAQMLARCLGAEVRPHETGWHEIGYTEIVPAGNGDNILGDVRFFYQWHGEGFDLPSGCELLAAGASGHFPHQMYRMNADVYGVQFHPECTIDIIKYWAGIEEPHPKLEYPGAQSTEEQLANAAKYDHLVDAWVPGFIDTWLGASPAQDAVRDAAE
ncbi:MAG: glutamine amidotransferase [Rhodospirillaceae bacterium]|nr:glutamine amidotransferase [Rhodospirillaceae bacterium]|tara:strand:+ start:11828 stop:12568 length:741 start_codon:yes stop_codon:yes gene_type:complete